MQFRRLAFFYLVVLAVSVAAQPSPAARSEFVKYDSPVIVLDHVRVIDGTGGPAREDQSIVIANGRIQGMGKSGGITLPEAAHPLDLTGYSVIPGLVGMHDHMYYPGPRGSTAIALYPEHAASFPRLYLAGGVTSVRTTGSIETYTDLELKRLIDEGKVIGPKMHITGPYLEGEGAFTPQMHQVKNAEDARQTVNFWAEQGVTSFKAYMHLTRAELGAAVEAAHKRGLKVTGHLCAVGFREAAALGIDNLEHGIAVDTEFYSQKKPDVCPNTAAVQKELAETVDVNGAPMREMIRDLVARHIAVTSTLPVFETFVPGRAPTQARILDVMLPEAREAYQSAVKRVGDNGANSSWPALFKKEMQFEHAFVQAGGTLLAGLDPTGLGGVIAGFGDQREVELLVEAGFTPLEAIHIATANGAQFLGELDEIGTLATGKKADLVLVKGDPSSRISDIENVETVFKDGIGYDSAKLIDSVKGAVGLR